MVVTGAAAVDRGPLPCASPGEAFRRRQSSRWRRIRRDRSATSFAFGFVVVKLGDIFGPRTCFEGSIGRLSCAI